MASPPSPAQISFTTPSLELSLIEEPKNYDHNINSSPNTSNHFNPETFRSQAYRMVDLITDYYKNIESYPVLSQVKPGYLRSSLPKTAPYNGESLDDILEDFKQYIVPGITHWVSPNFFAFFPATVSTAGFLGEMMCTAFNTVGFNWLASPAATELEMVVVDWLASMLGLPKSFMFSGTGGGVLHATTSEAVLCTLIAARDRALERIGSDNISKLVVYGSDQTHSTFNKASKLAGIPPHNIRLLNTSHSTNFALSPTLLHRAIESDLAAGLIPIYLCVTLGTTSTAAIDPIDALAEVAKQHYIWVHIDAAYGGSACICPEFRHNLNGVERVDSLSLATHKWLLSCLDCCCLWVKKPSVIINALRTNPEYLKNDYSESNSVVDYKDWQIGTGRRFKSIRLWMVMRSHGIKNLQAHIRSDVRMAKMFEGLVKSDRRFEVVVPAQFSLVCFRVNPFPEPNHKRVDELNRSLLEWVNSTGQVYMTHTIVGGIYMIRFAIGATLTEERHVTAAWELIKKGADKVLLTNDSNTGEMISK